MRRATQLAAGSIAGRRPPAARVWQAPKGTERMVLKLRWQIDENRIRYTEPFRPGRCLKQNTGSTGVERVARHRYTFSSRIERVRS